MMFCSALVIPLFFKVQLIFRKDIRKKIQLECRSKSIRFYMKRHHLFLWNVFFSFFLISQMTFFYPIKYIHIHYRAKSSFILHFENHQICQKWRKTSLLFISLKKTQLKIKSDTWQIYLSIYEDSNNPKLCLLLWWWMSGCKT